MLLVAYYTKYWVGFRFDGAVYFQFLAKLHELLMQASIIHINMSIIRMAAVDNYVPVGILSGATQSAQLSYFWSLDFWSALRKKESRQPYRNRVLLTVCFPFLLLLTALVGPAFGRDFDHTSLQNASVVSKQDTVCIRRYRQGNRETVPFLCLRIFNRHG